MYSLLPTQLRSEAENTPVTRTTLHKRITTLDLLSLVLAMFLNNELEPELNLENTHDIELHTGEEAPAHLLSNDGK